MERIAQRTHFQEERGMVDRKSPSLKESQARRIRVTCHHIDTLLTGIEHTLHESSSNTIFPRDIPDINPAQARTIENYIARIRAQLIRVMDGQGILPEGPTIPATRSIRTVLASIDISIEELKPKYMRGYGDVPEDLATELNGIAGELQSLVAKLDRYVAEDAGQDLRLRLNRLEQAGNDLRTLANIEQVVAAHGLVEFRGTIASILDRAEDKSFEIAVFGRVSSGKSSLLNAMLDTDILPVGVTPVTAVPSRITFGDTPAMQVSFTDSPPQTFDIARLGEFATEQQNPGNAKHVTRIVVTLPSPCLRDGITFVDTPGLGSLATRGAAETLAYLPRCDLGVVLVDAGSTLTTEDVATVLALQEAAIPVNVLLSKVDLISTGDCEKILHYVKQHLVAECNLTLPVYVVSVLSSHRRLLDRWFDDQIFPLYSHARELKGLSLSRKIGALRESVILTLQTRLQRTAHLPSGKDEDIRAVEARLRRATGAIQGTRSAAERELEDLTRCIPEIAQEVASKLMEAGSSRGGHENDIGEIVRQAVLQAVLARTGKIQDVVETLASQLRDDLLTSAEALGVPDIPGEEEFQSLVRGMPVFDPGEIQVSIPPSAFTSLLGKQHAEKQMAERIRQQLGRSFEQMLASHYRILLKWTKDVTTQLGRMFEMYAEGYRAQAERSLNGHAPTADKIDAIERDLELLAERN